MESVVIHDEQTPKSVDSADIKNEAMKFMRIVMFSPAKAKFGKSNEQSEDFRNIRRVIVNFHGGGFVCMSTDTHQKYLR